MLRILSWLVLLITSLCFPKPSPTNTHYLEEILSYVNRDIDPCDDFYGYACGNWKPQHVDSKWEKKSVLKQLTNNIIHSINGFLVNDNADLNNVYPQQLGSLRKYYQVCLKSTKSPVKKSSYYLDVLKEIGGFPALDSTWDSTKFDWIAMASHLNVFGCKNILAENVYPMYPFPFGLEKMDLGIHVALNTKTFKSPADIAYQVNSDEMLKLLRLYEVDDEKSQLIVKDILEFIKSIMKYNIISSELKLSNITDDFMIYEEGEDIDAIYRTVLKKYMNIAWNLTDDESIDAIVMYHESVEKIVLNKIVRLINETRPEVVANYLSLKFLYYLHGDQEMKTNNNKKFCTLETMKINGYFTSLLYNSTIPNEEQRRRSEDVVKLIKELLESLEISINSTTWLDQATMDEAAKKIRKIRINIGQVNDDLGSILLSELLKLNFTDDYEKNLLQLLRFKVDTTHLPFKRRNLLNETTKPLQILDSTQVNAFYFVLDNSVYIANGILNAPLYDKDQHSAVKYSRMGYILGHELFHAFDSIGRLFDAKGIQRNWWSKVSEKAYEEKSTCFKKDLSNIYMEDLQIFVDGNNTADESVADGIGVSMAFDAFMRNSKDEEDTWCLDHGITKEQLFFISFSQVYCASYTKNNFLNELYDEHLQDPMRIKPALSHSTRFSEHFKCKKGSKMNPQKKCHLF